MLQEVYTTVWRKSGASSTPTVPARSTWMVTIARNRAIDRLRSRTSRPSAPLDEAAEVRDTRPAADELIDASTAARRIHAALAGLDARHADAIRSTYFEGLTYEALAERENIPVGTLKSWVRRGLLRMRGELA